MNDLGKRTPAVRGFSLIELLVVMAILAVIAVTVAPSLLGKADDANVDAAKIQIEKLAGAIELYRLEVGSYPPNLEALHRNPGDTERWRGPYVRKAKELRDPWHNDYVYRRPGENGPFDIISLGADGSAGGEGTDADIGSWE